MHYYLPVIDKIQEVARDNQLILILKLQFLLMSLKEWNVLNFLTRSKNNPSLSTTGIDCVKLEEVLNNF